MHLLINNSGKNSKLGKKSIYFSLIIAIFLGICYIFYGAHNSLYLLITLFFSLAASLLSIIHLGNGGKYSDEYCKALMKNSSNPDYQLDTLEEKNQCFYFNFENPKYNFSCSKKSIEYIDIHFYTEDYGKRKTGTKIFIDIKPKDKDNIYLIPTISNITSIVVFFGFDENVKYNTNNIYVVEMSLDLYKKYGITKEETFTNEKVFILPSIIIYAFSILSEYFFINKYKAYTIAFINNILIYPSIAALILSFVFDIVILKSQKKRKKYNYNYNPHNYINFSGWYIILIKLMLYAAIYQAATAILLK